MKAKPAQLAAGEQQIVDTVRVRPVRNAAERRRCLRLLAQHHYLGALQAVGEQVFYVAHGPNGGWRAVLVFCAAAKHLGPRDRWIGWTAEQRRRRLALVANNARYLVLPRFHVPNLATRVMRLTLDRLSADWQQRYGHPLAVVETFVDPQQFQGTVYRAGGWEELGPTRGFGRVGRDYYVAHRRPKRLFVRELCRNARRGLQAEHLKPPWACVEAKVAPCCTHKAGELRSLVESPSQPTFCRLLQHVPGEQVEAAILAFQAQVRGPAPREGVAAMDGKAVKRSGGEMILSAVSVPSLHYLGSAPVPTDKTNEIPVARDLLQRLDVEGRLVGLDALHPQMETACRIVQGAGGDYMLTLKDNQKGIRRTVQGLLAGTPAAFSPSAPDVDHGLDRRDESRAPGTPATA